MHYDLGFIDLEQKTLHPLAHLIHEGGRFGLADVA
jgi:hypothetical protein